MEFLDIYNRETDTCEVLGLGSYSTFSLLDNNDPNKGLKLAYGGGQICHAQGQAGDGQPRKVTFNLYCGDQEDEEFSLDEVGGMQGTTKCNLHFKYTSPKVCPNYVESVFSTGPGGSGSSFWFWMLIIGFGVYMGFGTWYNRTHYQLEGMSAVPHIDLFRAVPNLLCSCFSKQKKGGGYDEV